MSSGSGGNDEASVWVSASPSASLAWLSYLIIIEFVLLENEMHSVCNANLTRRAHSAGVISRVS